MRWAVKRKRKALRTADVQLVLVIALVSVGGADAARVDARVLLDVHVLDRQPMITVDRVVHGVRMTIVDRGAAVAAVDDERLAVGRPRVRQPLDGLRTRRVGLGRVEAADRDAVGCYDRQLS